MIRIWLTFLCSLGTIGPLIEGTRALVPVSIEVEKRALKGVPNKTSFDAIVVSMGGSGCTSMLAKVSKAMRKSNGQRPRINRIFNDDRLKHAFPSTIFRKELSFRHGIIYVYGNLSLAVKSLTRRHFITSQVNILRGDKAWLKSLHYHINGSTSHPEGLNIPLFRKAPKQEKHDDESATTALVSGSKTTHPNLIRLQQIFARAGSTGKDPLGLFQHFQAWSNSSSYADAPHGTHVLFLNIAKMDSSWQSTEKLKAFLKISGHVNISFAYSPRRRKMADSIDQALELATPEVRSLMQKGLKIYDQLTLQMESWHERSLSFR
jgi:hypothetical protein